MAGRKDDLGWMVMPFAETIGKRIDLGRKVEFNFGRVKCEVVDTSVEMTNGGWRNLSGALGEVLTIDLHVRIISVWIL